MTREEFTECVVDILEPMCRVTFTPAMQVGWYAFLHQYNPTESVRGIRACLLDRKRNDLPSIGEVVECIERFRGAGIESQADDLFSRIMHGVRCYGFGGAERARDQMGEDAWGIVERIGWSTFCDIEPSKKTVLLAQTRSAVQSLRKHQRERKRIDRAGERDVELIGEIMRPQRIE